MSFINPEPAGVITREDQGVDIGNAPGGSPVYDPVPGLSKFVQVIRNWYRGQSFNRFQILTGPFKGQSWYAAEQVNVSVPMEGTVSEGQQFGSVAPSGTGIEYGGASSTGQPLPNSPIRSGIINAAGKRVTLSQLWIDAGGDPRVANIMAAIAMAESGGNPSAVQKGQPYATTGWGLWQITPGDSVPSVGVNQQLLNPYLNAKAAVAKYNSQGLGAWTTYTSGAYKAFLTTAPSTLVNYGGPNGGIVRPGGQPTNSGAEVDTVLQNYITLRDTPRTAPPGTKNPFQWWLASFTGNWSALQGTGSAQS